MKKAFHYFKKGCDYDERRSCYNKALYNLGHMDQCRDFINAKDVSILKEMDSQIHTSSPKLVNQIYLYVVTKFKFNIL